MSFDWSVCLGMPSFAAAPTGPAIRPWHAANAASMISFFAPDKHGDKRNRWSRSLPFPLQPGLVNGKGFAIAQYDGPLDDILQLANVAGPVVGLKQRQCLFPYVLIFLPDLFA